MGSAPVRTRRRRKNRLRGVGRSHRARRWTTRVPPRCRRARARRGTPLPRAASRARRRASRRTNPSPARGGRPWATTSAAPGRDVRTLPGGWWQPFHGACAPAARSALRADRSALVGEPTPARSQPLHGASPCTEPTHGSRVLHGAKNPWVGSVHGDKVHAPIQTWRNKRSAVAGSPTGGGPAVTPGPRRGSRRRR